VTFVKTTFAYETIPVFTGWGTNTWKMVPKRCRTNFAEYRPYCRIFKPI